MSEVNIPKSVVDPFYRYKRNVIKIEIHNNNGGITKLENIELISKQLDCNLDDLLKYIKKTLNANIIKKNGIFIKKIETVDNLEKILEEYIRKEILCTTCNNPEFIEGKKYKVCKACGHNR